MEIGDNCQIDVRGQMLGQAVNNTFHYIFSSGTASMETLVTAFRTLWRAEILALIGVQYQVDKYIGAVIEGFVFNGPVTTPANYRFGPRFTDSFELAGDPVLDDGDIVTDCLPSYAAVSITKKCGTLTDFDENEVTLEKQLRGGCRISGIPVADIQSADPNRLDAAILTAWQDAATSLREIADGGNNWLMEVISMQKNNLPRTRIVGGLAEPYPVRGTVSSLTVSPFISSQVSRKQTIARLG